MSVDNYGTSAMGDVWANSDYDYGYEYRQGLVTAQAQTSSAIAAASNENENENESQLNVTNNTITITITNEAVSGLSSNSNEKEQAAVQSQSQSQSQEIERLKFELGILQEQVAKLNDFKQAVVLELLPTSSGAKSLILTKLTKSRGESTGEKGSSKAEVVIRRRHHNFHRPVKYPLV